MVPSYLPTRRVVQRFPIRWYRLASVIDRSAPHARTYMLPLTALARKPTVAHSGLYLELLSKEAIS